MRYTRGWCRGTESHHTGICIPPFVGGLGAGLFPHSTVSPNEPPKFLPKSDSLIVTWQIFRCHLRQRGSRIQRARMILAQRTPASLQQLLLKLQRPIEVALVVHRMSETEHLLRPKIATSCPTPRPIQNQHSAPWLFPPSLQTSEPLPQTSPQLQGRRL